MPTPPVPRPGPVPMPPTGVPARQRRETAAHRTPHLPVSNETSAGGIAVRVEDGIAYAACIGRRNRAGRLEWCLPKGHIEEGRLPRSLRCARSRRRRESMPRSFSRWA
ncbi:hypothetical protein GCM10025873_22130 [Demequina sediminis]|nr:hypothetical protein GCM10025873_22130 [Demequina sediminis]